MLQVPRRQTDEAVVRDPGTPAHIQQLQLCTCLQDALHKVIADGARERGDRQLLEFREARGIHLKKYYFNKISISSLQ